MREEAATGKGANGCHLQPMNRVLSPVLPRGLAGERYRERET